MSNPRVALISHVGSLVPNEIAHPLIIARLMRRVVKMSDGCWNWTGPRSKKGKGYGWASYKGKAEHVMRVMYRAAKGNGQIPMGKEICHTCDNTACINPDHLYAGTRADNVRDMQVRGRGNHQKKIACIHGHPFTSVNTYITKLGHRHCKTCQLIRMRINAGWTKEQAQNLPLIPHGYTRHGRQQAT